MVQFKVGFFAPINLDRFAGDTVRILELINGLRKLRVQVEPFLPGGGKEDISKLFRPYHELPYLLPKNYKLRFISLLAFSQYLPTPPKLDSDYDFIQLEVATAFPASVIRKIVKKKNVIFDMHSLIAIDLRPYIHRIFRSISTMILLSAQDYLCANANCIVVGHQMKKLITGRLKIDADNLHVIPNGVNLEIANVSIRTKRFQFEHLKDGIDLLIGYIGGLEWYEGVDTAIRAFAKYCKNNPNSKFVIAGNGSDKDDLFALVKKLKLDEKVIFLGWISYEDTFALQNVCDVLIAARKPLEKKGIDISAPAKIPSYLSAGRPIISSNIGEIPYVARHLKEAILVDELTDIAFAEAIETIASDDDLKRRLSQNARLRARKYSWDKIAKQLKDVYQSILTEK